MEVKRRFFITLPDGKTERPSTWTRRASVGGGFFKRKEDAAGFAELRERRGKNASGRTGVNRAICDDLPGVKRVFDLPVEARKRRISKRFDADFFEKIYEELSAADRETADATLGKDWKNGRND